MYGNSEEKSDRAEKYNELRKLFFKLQKANSSESREAAKREIRIRAEELGITRIKFPVQYQSESDLQAYKEILLRKLKR